MYITAGNVYVIVVAMFYYMTYSMQTHSKSSITKRASVLLIIYYATCMIVSLKRIQIVVQFYCLHKMIEIKFTEQNMLYQYSLVIIKKYFPFEVI